LLHHPGDAATAAEVMKAVNLMPEAEQSRVLVPSALPYLLPVGLVGLFCAVMMAALISSHNGFMHAWGGVLLQDIILPFRAQPLSTRAHLWALRGAMVCVGLIAFVLSCTFHPQQSILMLFAAVNNIWLGPAGAVMLGGLYWKRGTTRAAMTTLLVGSAVGLVFFGCQQLWPAFHDKAEFPINGQWIFLITIIFSSALYAFVSWLDPQPDFRMEKMLHRGAYAVKGEALPELQPTKWWQTIFGITPMFNRRDRLTAYLVVGWFVAWLGVFGVGMIYGLIADPGQLAWAKFWHFYLYLSFSLLIGTTLWLGIGGLRDLRNLIYSLCSTERDFSDDGSVKQGARAMAGAATKIDNNEVGAVS
jgi:SSS family solute:Na+ symporter